MHLDFEDSVSPLVSSFTDMWTSSINIGNDLFFTWKLALSAFLSDLDWEFKIVSLGIISEASDNREEYEEESERRKEPRK